MIRVRCPICQREMTGEGQAEWPELPFCSPRCRLIDLGRWLGETYGYPVNSGSDDGESSEPDEADIPP